MTFNAFDPYAMLAEQAAPAAKVAKDAKVDDATLKTLASLATLAEKPVQFHHPVAADWQEFFDERAGIAEHCGQMARDEAECMAYESCVARWLDTHPNDAICSHCQQPNGAPWHHAYRRYRVTAAMYGCTMHALNRGGCGGDKKQLTGWHI